MKTIIAAVGTTLVAALDRIAVGMLCTFGGVIVADWMGVFGVFTCYY